jgi:hypothetical protein
MPPSREEKEQIVEGENEIAEGSESNDVVPLATTENAEELAVNDETATPETRFESIDACDHDLHQSIIRV